MMIGYHLTTLHRAITDCLCEAFRIALSLLSGIEYSSDLVLNSVKIL